MFSLADDPDGPGERQRLSRQVRHAGLPTRPLRKQLKLFPRNCQGQWWTAIQARSCTGRRGHARGGHGLRRRGLQGPGGRASGSWPTLWCLPPIPPAWRASPNELKLKFLADNDFAGPVRRGAARGHPPGPHHGQKRQIPGGGHDAPRAPRPGRTDRPAGLPVRSDLRLRR